MMSNSELLLSIMRLALTTAALTIPAISVAYFLISRSGELKERMSKVIGYGSISAIVLVSDSIFSFIMLFLGYENDTNVLAVSGIMFTIGCSLLLYSLVVLAGFKREIPMIPPKEERLNVMNIEPSNLLIGFSIGVFTTLIAERIRYYSKENYMHATAPLNL